KGLDGYISIEVPPTIANDTESTISEALRYYQAIGKPNVMIKIPGTAQGLPAVERVISEGINVNVTLLFSVDSYVETFWAYIRGLEARAAKGLDVSNIASVASFFLSRIDINIDGKIDEKLKNVTDISTKAKLEAVKGKIAIANAKVAYQKYKKNPNYSDVMYVDELIGPDTVNTLPPNTVEACFDHCDVAPRIENNVAEAYSLIESLKDPDIDINLDKVMEDLLLDGIEKFVSPFQSLMDSLEEKVKRLAPV
ncbi:MAG: transaldolase, partial [Oscillatoriales cyanobacterium]